MKMKDNSPDAAARRTHPAGMGGPDMGPREAPGKSNMPDANLRTGMLPKPEAVRTATEDVGAFKRALVKQVGTDGDGDPKKRARNFWGRDSKDEV